MRILLSRGAALLAALATAAPAFASSAADPFVASRDPAAFDRALECLTQAVYYEARSESDDGQRAVAQVILNRVRHPSYPNSVCGVVYQGSHRATGCQFTFTCDGSIGGWVEPYAWDRARRVATAALRGNVYRPVGLALNYHTTAIRPYWAPSLVPQTTVGAHIFYRRPGFGGTSDAFNQTPSGDEPDTITQPLYAAARTPIRRAARPARDRYAPTPVLEIPVVERPVLYRTISGRQTASGQTASGQTASGQTASGTPARPTARAAAIRTGPRMTVSGGIRVFRGGGNGASN